ncbi:type I-C CRISPR-associated protein Cas8c/Csd1 [Avibacterium sp. 21-586]|uniref:type I-C CRISPR-associated protein Cas8c/Csd1 n=1 Tax=Avibacterium sp. 21-586 TaxID=2911534 RepID=UPI00224774DA|nr:type I-C CRISPR-associated protein Cas8c/Csd1 [Avibacterium sp. 21-586]MCW9709996.1 type I-C CRISPR-associated protein Cas8c/Csd1 [Avibacterium sp. 21-586]
MILLSLVRYYQRLSAQKDRDTGEPKVPSYGFSEEKIGYILVLNPKGELVDVIPNLTDDKKPRPKLMNVPQAVKRTSGIKPNFLWDKAAYVLGVEANQDKASAQMQPALLSHHTFDAFKQFHLEALADTQDKGLQALVKFLTTWESEKFTDSLCPIEILDANVVFKLDGENQYIHQSVEAQNLWAGLLSTNDKTEGICLITGEKAPIARLHPSIKGIQGGQSSGGSIISFNKDAFTSFNKDQGDNAPVSEQAAFAYTTALNYLLRNKNHHLMIGDTSTVFWAEAEDVEQAELAEQLFAGFLTPPDDEQENSPIFDMLEKMSKGRPLQEINLEIAPSTRFFILGLAPNASRISIRFWLETSFGELANNLAMHWQDLALNPRPWKTPPSIWRLLLQTTPLDRTGKGKSENISPVLAGELARAIFTDSLYPMNLLSQLLMRFRADGQITGLRIAMVKAVLQRRFRKGLIKQGVPMELDENTDHTAYLLGRLFALLVRVQEQALGKVNANIANRYYSSASTVPYMVFPRLLRGAQHHFSRLKKDNVGLAINLSKELDTILAKLPTVFPRHLNIEEQGRFALGYYQEK